MFLVGHIANDHRWSARGKQCRKCNGTEHFGAVCKTKRKQNSGPGRGAGGMHRPDSRRWSGGHYHNRQVEVEDKESDD